MIVVYTSLFISLVCFINNATAQEYYDWFTNVLGMKDYSESPQTQDIYLMKSKIDTKDEIVNLKLYYESLCPACKQLEKTQFKNVVMLLSPYLDIKTYPYGNARIVDGEVNCQHGPEECYGNKLHACSLKYITNHTEALLFNICMMDPETGGSDDAEATKCANEMNVDKDPILKCAKGSEGQELLLYYGKESEKVKYKYVPYLLINGVEFNGQDLMKDICAAFKKPPSVCQQ